MVRPVAIHWYSHRDARNGHGFRDRFDGALEHVRDLSDNPNAGFRIVFSGGSTASGGVFVSIDNLQVVGK
jgi:hypothetical protein